eukprot:GHVS01075500.1.p1 GENE.GHVS01075500.1~~GHVS01075500.1.p1  ORF type:complete len:609 (+),score=167.86 GHVS01075500.1:30-1829(+)
MTSMLPLSSFSSCSTPRVPTKRSFINRPCNCCTTSPSCIIQRMCSWKSSIRTYRRRIVRRRTRHIFSSSSVYSRSDDASSSSSPSHQSVHYHHNVGSSAHCCLSPVHHPCSPSPQLSPRGSIGSPCSPVISPCLSFFCGGECASTSERQTDVTTATKIMEGMVETGSGSTWLSEWGGNVEPEEEEEQIEEEDNTEIMGKEEYDVQEESMEVARNVRVETNDERSSVSCRQGREDETETPSSNSDTIRVVENREQFTLNMERDRAQDTIEEEEEEGWESSEFEEEEGECSSRAKKGVELTETNKRVCVIPHIIKGKLCECKKRKARRRQEKGGGRIKQSTWPPPPPEAQWMEEVSTMKCCSDSACEKPVGRALWWLLVFSLGAWWYFGHLGLLSHKTSLLLEQQQQDEQQQFFQQEQELRPMCIVANKKAKTKIGGANEMYNSAAALVRWALVFVGGGGCDVDVDYIENRDQPKCRGEEGRRRHGSSALAALALRWAEQIGGGGRIKESRRPPTTTCGSGGDSTMMMALAGLSVSRGQQPLGWTERFIQSEINKAAYWEDNNNNNDQQQEEGSLGKEEEAAGSGEELRRRRGHLLKDEIY